MIGNEARQNAQIPEIHYFDTVTSTMDIAFDIAGQGRLREWDSVQANMQTEGRGQMRRKWVSLPGNLFTALRLPNAHPFNSSGASVAIGALCASSLRTLGCQVMMKWPNDLIIVDNDRIIKAGGILVEEKGGILIAGIGINLYTAPDEKSVEMEDSQLLPGALPKSCKSPSLPDADEYWRALVKHIYSIYKSGPVFASIWKDLAAELLLWRGLQVCLNDSDEKCEGILLGVGDTGGAILKTASGVREKTGGTMRLVDNVN